MPTATCRKPGRWHYSAIRLAKTSALIPPLGTQEFLDEVREVVNPILDAPPPSLGGGGLADALAAVRDGARMARAGWRHRGALVPMYELITGPAAHILDRWFDGEVLKTTLATDAVIGAMVRLDSWR